MSGDPARFICGLIRGGRNVKFSWTKNGNALITNERIRVINDIDNSVLTIRETNVHDSGNYACVAKNLFSESRELTRLRVEGEIWTWKNALVEMFIKLMIKY